MEVLEIAHGFDYLAAFWSHLLWLLTSQNLQGASSARGKEDLGLLVRVLHFLGPAEGIWHPGKIDVGLPACRRMRVGAEGALA